MLCSPPFCTSGGWSSSIHSPYRIAEASEWPVQTTGIRQIGDPPAARSRSKERTRTGRGALSRPWLADRYSLHCTPHPCGLSPAACRLQSIYIYIKYIPKHTRGWIDLCFGPTWSPERTRRADAAGHPPPLLQRPTKQRSLAHCNTSAHIRKINQPQSSPRPKTTAHSSQSCTPPRSLWCLPPPSSAWPPRPWPPRRRTARRRSTRSPARVSQLVVGGID